MIEVIEKGYERIFVKECNHCHSVITYELQDTLCGTRVICPICNREIYVDFIPYKEEKQ